MADQNDYSRLARGIRVRGECEEDIGEVVENLGFGNGFTVRCAHLELTLHIPHEWFSGCSLGCVSLSVSAALVAETAEIVSHPAPGGWDGFGGLTWQNRFSPAFPSGRPLRIHPDNQWG